MPHPNGIYTAQLDQMTQTLSQMGELIAQALDFSESALEHHERALGLQAKELDKRINALNEQLEAQVIRLFTHAAPFASDLRFVIAILKASGSLERAGDLAKSTTKHMAKLDFSFSEDVLAALRELVNVNRQMLAGVILSMRNRDVEQALEAWRMDDVADAACRRVFEIIRHKMTQEPARAGQLADLLFAAKNFERMADYCADIAKMVIYVVTGEHPHKDVLREQP
ncbi:MAG: phosphate signaling complex protein PhoU [Rickettsiales bacterium]|nr:phosphate signaling complex protein PhoU [Rickettsiales bacterium]